MHPLKVLREYLATHPQLKQYSTQRGFGRLIGKSDAYVRLLEKPGGMNPKVAKIIQTTTDVAANWLLLDDVTNSPIPATDGTDLTHDKVFARLQNEIDSNVAQATAIGTPAFVELILNKQRKAMLSSIANNDPKLLHDILNVLVRAGVFNDSDYVFTDKP